MDKTTRALIVATHERLMVQFNHQRAESLKILFTLCLVTSVFVLGLAFVLEAVAVFMGAIAVVGVFASLMLSQNKCVQKLSQSAKALDKQILKLGKE